MKELRLSASQRVTGVIWGLIVAGAAVTAMVALSGTEVEIVNVIIVALVALGTWLLASALAAVRPRKRPAADEAAVEAAIADDLAAAEPTAEVATSDAEPAEPSDTTR